MVIPKMHLLTMEFCLSDNGGKLQVVRSSGMGCYLISFCQHRFPSEEAARVQVNGVILYVCLNSRSQGP